MKFPRIIGWMAVVGLVGGHAQLAGEIYPSTEMAPIAPSSSDRTVATRHSEFSDLVRLPPTRLPTGREDSGHRAAQAPYPLTGNGNGTVAVAWLEAPLASQDELESAPELPPELQPGDSNSPETDDDLDDEELDALLSSSDPLSSSPNDRLSMYGYADTVFGYNRYGSGTTGFDMYHWQTFFEYRVTDRVTFIGDLLFEHGPIHTGKNLGDIKTRAYMTVELKDWCKLNVGKFLTPFGEYNLYHDASPVYTSVNSPRSIYWKRGIGVNTDGSTRKDRFFAKEGTGAWLWGVFDFGEDLHLRTHEDWTLEYNAYLINGRGTGNVAKVDSNDNKGVGGKIVIDSPQGFNVGCSIYGDMDTRLIDAGIIHHTIALQAGHDLRVIQLFGEIAWADYGADGAARGYYAQVDYPFKDALTAYYRCDRYDDLTPGMLEGDEFIHTFGLNWAISPGVYFKIEHGYYELDEDVFQCQLAIAY